MLKLVCVGVLTIAAVWHCSEAVSISEIYNQKFRNSSSRFIVGYGAQNKAYYLDPERLTDWYAANNDCLTMGWKLVEIQSFDDLNDFRAFLTDNKKENADYWAAGNDLQKYNKWLWGVSGEEFSYTNWAPDEPNNDGGNEHCLVTRARYFDWNDANCRQIRQYVCEENVQSRSYV